MTPTEAAVNRRQHPRVPPMECRLVLKPPGWRAWVSPNLVVQWIDVSEGGIGVLVSRELRVGEQLRARLSNPAYRDAFDATVEVAHIRASRSSPGQFVAGMKFIEPSRVMRASIRSLVDTGCMPTRGILEAFRRSN